MEHLHSFSEKQPVTPTEQHVHATTESVHEWSDAEVRSAYDALKTEWTRLDADIRAEDMDMFMDVDKSVTDPTFVVDPSLRVAEQTNTQKKMKVEAEFQIVAAEAERRGIPLQAKPH